MARSSIPNCEPLVRRSHRGGCGAALSVIPSLIPARVSSRACIGGVLAAIGCGLGVLVGWTIRRLRHRPDWRSDERARRRLLTGTGLVTGATGGQAVAKADLAQITGVRAPGSVWVGVAALAAFTVFLVLLLSSRGASAGRPSTGSRTAQIRLTRVATASAVTVSVVIAARWRSIGCRRPWPPPSRPVPIDERRATPTGVNPPASPVVSGGPDSADPRPWVRRGKPSSQA